MDKLAFCNTCPYMERDLENLQAGVCHAEPPKPQAIGPGQTIGMFPPINPAITWCGKHPQRALTALTLIQ